MATCSDVHMTQDELTLQSTAAADLKRYLKRIGPAYLSTARATAYNDALTEKDRDEIDYETRHIIQTQMAALEKLQELERGRAEKQKTQRFGFFANPKTAGINHTVELHRQGVLWYLRSELKAVSDMQAQQQEIRLSRQMAKSKSRLQTDNFYGPAVASKPQPSNLASAAAAASEYDSHKDVANELPPEQIQELEQENSVLLRDLEVSLDKVQSAHKSLVEIAELQNKLITELASQSDTIQHMLEQADDATADVGFGTKELASARRKNRTTSKIIVYSSVTVALILLTYDFIL